MKSFIEHIIEDYNLENIKDLKDSCFVFPSRRAGVYFDNLLKREFPDTTFWSPKILSIEDFVIHCNGQSITDDITLLFDLFKSYKQFDKSIKIERFYSWGQVLMSDFDEIDRYMADADKVYSSLKELKDIQTVFGEPEEIKHALKEFQKLFDSRETVLMNRFVQNWEIIRKTYSSSTAVDFATAIANPITGVLTITLLGTLAPWLKDVQRLYL